MNTQSKIRDWNPDEGDARQGDVYLFRIPDTIKISNVLEIEPRAGRLVLLAGEFSGHHHAIKLPQSEINEKQGRSLPHNNARPGNARMYRDARAAEALVQAGELTRGDLCIGFLVVETGPVVLRHEEHDAIRIPIGRYYCGRQIESTVAERDRERLVQD